MLEQVFQIKYDEDADRYYIDDYALHCGDCFEVLVFNGLTNKAEWVETSIEGTRDTWYLTGLAGYDIGGLFARFGRRY